MIVGISDRIYWSADLIRTSGQRALRSELVTGYIGWHGHENLGDDVMLEALRAMIPNKPLETFAGARREKLLAKVGLSGPTKFDQILLGGGTLINENYLDVVRCALNLGLTVSTLGTGVGSSGFDFDAEVPSEEWRLILPKFKQIGVRGPHSLAKLKALGVKDAEIIGDLALGLTADRPIADPTAKRFLLNFAAPQERQTGFPTHRMIAQFADAVGRLKELELDPIPVAFCKEDVPPLQQVMSAAKLSTPIHRPRTATEFFELAHCSRLTIGVRLHAAVLSTCAGLASLTVAYRGKGKDFAASVGLDDWMVDANDEGLADRAEALAASARRVGESAHSAALALRGRLREYVARMQPTAIPNETIRRAGLR